MTHTGLRSVIATTAILALALVGLGCAAAEPDPEERAAIEQVALNSLHGLAKAYSSLNLEHLEGHASPVEIRNVRNLLQQLANSGDRVEATLVGIEITGFDIFRQVNASVALVEVWDIIRFEALTGREKGRTNGSVQTTLLQLRRIDGVWQVIGRNIVDRETGSGLEDEGEQG